MVTIVGNLVIDYHHLLVAEGLGETHGDEGSGMEKIEHSVGALCVGGNCHLQDASISKCITGASEIGRVSVHSFANTITVFGGDTFNEMEKLFELFTLGVGRVYQGQVLNAEFSRVIEVVNE